MQEINLYHLLKYYAKNWLILLSAVFAGAIIGLVYTSYIQNPSYRSNATLFVVNNDQTAISKDSTLINNYMELIKSRRVLEPVIGELNLGKDFDQIVGAVSVSNQKDTAIIKLSVVADNPETGRNIANSAIESFKEQIKDLYGKENIQVVDSASLATSPYNVRKTLQVAVASIATLLFSVIIIFFIFDYKLSNGTLNKKNTKNTKASKSESMADTGRGKGGRFVKKKPTLKQLISNVFSRNKKNTTTKKAKKTNRVKKT